MNFYDVKTKLQGTFQYVLVSDEDLVDSNLFLAKGKSNKIYRNCEMKSLISQYSFIVLETFEVDDCDDIEALILDHHGVQIPLDRFGSIVKQFIQSGSFYVNIELVNRPNTSSAQV